MAQPRKLHDKYFKLAKADGYLARSAYKLLEINEKYRIIHPGDTVLDLGCAPGSWMQVAAECVGPRGLVIGIDLSESSPVVADSGADNVQCMVGDAFKIPPAEIIAAAGFKPGGGFDVVISDMAPNTTGHGDDLISSRLCRQVLGVLPQLLRPGGQFVMKIFEGSEFTNVVKETQAMFREARGFKPKACRDLSRETYIVAESFRPHAAPGRDERPRASRTAPPPPKPPAGWNV